MTDSRVFERIIVAVDAGKVYLDEWSYRGEHGRSVDIAVYAAEDRGYLVLLPGSAPEVTDAGRAWLEDWLRRKTAPAMPEFVEAVNG